MSMRHRELPMMRLHEAEAAVTSAAICALVAASRSQSCRSRRRRCRCHADDASGTASNATAGQLPVGLSTDDASPPAPLSRRRRAKQRRLALAQMTVGVDISWPLFSLRLRADRDLRAASTLPRRRAMPRPREVRPPGHEAHVGASRSHIGAKASSDAIT